MALISTQTARASDDFTEMFIRLGDPSGSLSHEKAKRLKIHLNGSLATFRQPGAVSAFSQLAIFAKILTQSGQKRLNRL